jgi:hypothetical protein
MKALTIRQPWAWLLIHGTKNIENRDWYTRVRGPLAIHAAKGMTHLEYICAVDFVRHIDPALADCIPKSSELIKGAVIGTMVLRDCVTVSRSKWFEGKYGFVLDSPEPFLDPVPCRGTLGFWVWAPKETA